MAERNKKLKREKKSSATSEENKKFSRSFHLIKTAFASVLIVVLAFVTWKQLKTRESPSQVPQLTYWPYDLNARNHNDNLRTIMRVFDRLGYKAVNGSNGESWDVLWSIESLFSDVKNMFQDLESHQLINHFPPITFMTHKM